MGKYSEALRKIEEERLKGNSLPSPGWPVRKLKFYLVVTAVILFVLVVAVYGHGIRKGLNLASTSQPQAVSQAKAEAIAPTAQKLETPVSETPKSQDNSMLLNSVEQLAELTYQDSKTLSASSGGSEMPTEAGVNQPTLVKQSEGFYTIQLASFQDREAAKSVAEDLRDEGYSAFVVLSSKYSAVCIDKFDVKTNAKARLSEIKSSLSGTKYQDAFIRYVKPKVSHD